MKSSSLCKRFGLTAQRGIGLIELLVSMLIGLFIMGGVLQLFSTSSQNAIAVSGSSRIQENVRFAFSRMADDIAQSGNLGCISASVAGASYSTNTPITAQDIQLDGSTFDFLSPIRFKNATDTGTGSASAGVRAPGTDEFSIGFVENVIRQDVSAIGDTSVTINDASSLTVGDIVAVSNCVQGAIFAVSGISGDVVSHSTTGGFDKQLSGFVPNTVLSAANVVSPFYLYGGKTGAYKYSVGKSAAATADCTSGANPTTVAVLGQANCALFRTDTGGARQELVQGVHDIQVTYGLTDSSGNLRFIVAPTATEADLVDRVQVTMAFNSIDNVNTVGNNIDQTANGLIIKTYSRTFNLFNRL